MSQLPRGVCLIKLPPHNYLHVLDCNAMVTRLEVGPATLRCREHEEVVLAPRPMLVVPPRHYCIVRNPAKGPGSANMPPALRHGELEIRIEQEEPFPLYPGESILGNITPLQVVPENAALRLHCHRDFEEESGAGKTKTVIKRRAGDEWLFYGPATYIPRVEVEIVEQRKAHIILPNTALRVRALRACADSQGQRRMPGEEWMVAREGAFLPSVDEAVVDTVTATVLTPKTALRLRACVTFADRFGRRHRKGEEWLVRHTDCESYVADVREESLGIVSVTAMTSRQFCVIANAAGESGVSVLGSRRLVRGPATFFIEPGEAIEFIRDIYVLSNNQALRVRCHEEFVEEIVTGGTPRKTQRVRRVAGSEWLVRGPCEYVPPLQVEVLRPVTAIIALEPLEFFVFERSSIVLSILIAIIAALLPFLLRRL